MPNLNWTTNLDANGFKKGSSEIMNAISEIDKKAQSLASIGAGLFMANKAKEFVGQMVQVRGEMQKLEKSYKTMLGSKEKADELMRETIELAATTPFDLKQVADGAKQLLAFGSSAKEVGKEITMLGNIASGLNIPFNDMVYLFGTTRTQGRMFTQDLRQFMGRGIPLAEELAKQFGVAKEEVGNLVTAGKVGFEEMNKALVAMTSDGGKFYNLMEEQSKTIAGQISNLEDALYQMYNKIGEANEETISKAISGVSYLVENYEEIGRVLGNLVISYGSYKAVLMATVAIKKTEAVWMNVKAFMSLSKELSVVTTAQQLFNTAASVNPYVWVASAVAGLVLLGKTLYDFNEKQNSAKRINEAVNDTIEENIKETAKEKAGLNALYGEVKACTEGTDKWKSAKDKMLGQYSKYLSEQNKEIKNAKELAEAYKDISKAIDASSEQRVKGKISSSISKQLEDEKQSVDEEIEKAISGMYEKVTVEYSELYKKVAIALEEGNIETLKKLKGEFRDISNQKGRDILSGGGFNTESRKYNDLANSINVYIKALESADKQLKSFGITTKEVSDEIDGDGKQDSGSMTYSLKSLIADIKTSENELKKLRSQTEKLDLKRIETEETNLDELKKKYKTLTGKEYGNVDKVETESERYIQELRIKLERDYKDLWLSVADAEILGMEEGTDKTLKQLDIEHQRKVNEIVQNAQDELLALNQQFDDKNLSKTSGKSGELYRSTVKSINSTMFQSLAGEGVSYNKSKDDVFKSVLDKYQDFDRQRLEIDKKYNADADVLRQQDTAEAKKALAELERMWKDAKKNISAEQLEYEKKNTSVLKKAFGNVAISTRKQLEETIGILEQYMQIIGADSEESALNIGKALGIDDETTKKIYENAQQVEEEINNINESITSLKSNRTGLSKIKDLFKSLAEGDSLDFKDNVSEAVGYVSQITSGIANASNYMHELAQISGNTNLEKTANAFDRITENINSAGRGAQIGASFGGLGAIIGAIIGGGSNIIGQVVKNNAQKRAEEAEIKKNFSDINREIEKIVYFNEKINEQGGIFGIKNTDFDEAKSYLEYQQKMIDEFYNKQYQSNLIQKNNLLDRMRTADGSKLTQAQRQSYLDLWGVQQSDYQNKSLNDYLKNLLGNDILEKFPNLINESGRLDLKIAEQVMNLITLEEAAKKTFGELIENEQNLLGAEERIANNLQSIFGGLGDSLANDLVKAFKTGEEAGESMAKSIDKVFDSYIIKLLSDDITNILNKYDDRLKIANEKGDLEDIARIHEEIKHDVQESEQSYKNMYGGLVGKDDTYSSSNNKGIAQASQDSVNELNGRLTTIQSHTFQITEMIRENQSRSADVLEELVGIRRNTDYIPLIMRSIESGVKIRD